MDGPTPPDPGRRTDILIVTGNKMVNFRRAPVRYAEGTAWIDVATTVAIAATDLLAGFAVSLFPFAWQSPRPHAALGRHRGPRLASVQREELATFLRVPSAARTGTARRRTAVGR